MTSLNPRQREAVHYADGPLLVLAGAGSGKTSVITRKIAWLIQERGVPARRIAAVTFTNKAAREMKERVQSLVQGGQSRGLIVSTFHNLGLRILKSELKACGLRSGFSILDQTDSREILKEILLQGESERDLNAVEAVHKCLSDWKNELVSPEEAVSQAQTEEEVRAAMAYSGYNRMLRACNAVDFDDLIMMPVQLFREQPRILEKWRHRLQYLLVDEYQDTNGAQYELVRMLTLPEGRFTVVGDDDQSIYAWRGARPENLDQLQQDWPALKVVKLEQNYRSTGRILKAANTVIANNPHVFEKSLWSDYGYGEPIRVAALRDEDGETDWIAGDLFHRRLQRGLHWKDFAILYRGNFQSRILEMKLQSLSIPYKVSGGTSFFSRSEIKDLMCYLRLLVNPDDDNAFLRIINTPRREVGPATLEKLAAWAGRRDQGLYHVCGDLGLSEAMPPKAAEKLREFKQWLDGKREHCFRHNSLQAVKELITEMDYEGWIMQNASSPRIGEKRIENVWQLVRNIERMLEKQEEEDDGSSDLEAVIGKLVLMDMLEQQDEEDDSDRVQLMTLHASKGLEFPHVYMMGVEEELLPHRTSIEEDNIVEERRLMYVGITRARETLTLTQARTRKQYGEKVDTTPSRFIDELPPDDLEYIGEGAPRDEERDNEMAEASLANLKALLE
ncbi:DNA helicase Rep [Alloalcanivorax xenomutans]|jgi:ATP-dependent DNA helicase Rep|uniref:ATP-dependent DNA helicase Rep n=1 Tax=Alloalcanivorax xenomutans TaxID=1094342 RepID=A0A9Q3W3T9_9GAMM|nr:DNA helicase Rep [Alloalcanivorax xenomutans]ERS14377.1 ATP-dependent DNA helicase Rep [Alcanivorax sp. PN-3]KYZ85520.1 ATP-dependent DNA helicase Rep [Alcanivorax sp. KX64203]MBA4721829.1 DNA helicase Rep [Alcanivorax sp.]ARB47469.1 ATP-dependent DNA helicase Rep [Alloalcanivorax xenomutans]MCE7508071.1 DNA helicase Rep [Alloalcanivorax xenomutans]|tara:strand:+ start:477 stop:2498 length:2022 start_codon:yes stop_codon:yes gene_type:complete